MDIDYSLAMSALAFQIDPERFERAAGGTRGGGGDDVEARIATVESDVRHIRSDIAEIKVDIRRLDDKIEGVRTSLDGKIESLRTSLEGRIEGVRTELGGRIDGVQRDIRELTASFASAKVWALLLYFGLAATLLGVMARGFGWL